MKKKLLISAVAAALTGVGAAHAVNVNPDGLGEVLIYPYFTVQNEFVTSVHVVNTTDEAKVVKVRFLEGKNSAEVLDFNLYLSPYDVWTGLVVNDDVAGGRLISTDTSCIAPAQLGVAGQAFRNFEFRTDADSANPDRRREGYVEIIEMGVLTDAAQIAAVTHVDGVPANCALIRSADNTPGGPAVDEPSGGLFGSGHLISVNGGVRTSYDAVALESFSDAPIWFTSGSTSPSLSNVSPAVGYLFAGDAVQEFTALGALDGRDSVDAVSAVLMHSSIANEYVIDAGRDSKTDWVVTFPTKRFYVNEDAAALTPFQSTWDPEALVACHDVGFTYYDREERGLTPEGGDFSPRPPGEEFGLCNEVNTLTLYRAGADVAASRLFGAVSTAADLAIEQFDAGWMAITFGTDLLTGVGYLPGEEGELVGLPVVGFSAMSNVNSVTVEVDGLRVFSSYMGSTTHKGAREFIPD